MANEITEQSPFVTDRLRTASQPDTPLDDSLPAFKEYSSRKEKRRARGREVHQAKQDVVVPSQPNKKEASTSEGEYQRQSDNVVGALTEVTLNLPTFTHHATTLRPQLQLRRLHHIVPALLSPTMNPTRLFIASLGNPPPYATTRHSAGHLLLRALQSHLQLAPFSKSKSFANGLTSKGSEIGRPEFTLWQSPSSMNVSGAALLKAYKTFAATAQGSTSDPLPGLVILYDEMETTPNQLRLRKGATSAKGHNGLKSVHISLQSAGLMDKLGDRYIKIGVGIGRPPGGSRASDDVSRYVLGQLSGSEKLAIEEKAGELASLLESEMIQMNK